MARARTMEDVRREIDRLDRALVRLLAERQSFIEDAGRIKTDRATIRDDARIEDVVAKVLDEARSAGLAPEIAEPIWRLLIEKSIDHEYKVFDAKTKD